MAESYDVDLTNVAHETVDGETVLVDLRTGVYFSLTGSAADMWLLLVSGADVDVLADAVRARYQPDGEAAVEALFRLRDELVRDGLLRVQSEPATADLPSLEPVGAGGFVPPVVERYTDMEHLLLLDPVHEVDVVGWPRPS